MIYPPPRNFRLMLAKQLESVAADLSYKPSEGECVEVEVERFRELLAHAELVAEYQANFEAMPRLSDQQVRNECEKTLKRLSKKLSDVLR